MRSCTCRLRGDMIALLHLQKQGRPNARACGIGGPLSRRSAFEPLSMMKARALPARALAARHSMCLSRQGACWRHTCAEPGAAPRADHHADPLVDPFANPLIDPLVDVLSSLLPVCFPIDASALIIGHGFDYHGFDYHGCDLMHASSRERQDSRALHHGDAPACKVSCSDRSSKTRVLF